jgi:hypothetical protein
MSLLTHHHSYFLSLSGSLSLLALTSVAYPLTTFGAENHFDDPSGGVCTLPQENVIQTQTFDEVLVGLSEDETIKRELKSETEILQYIECYKSTDKFDHDKFKKTYVPMLKRASASTGVPFSVLACFYFRESKYNEKVSSKDKNGKIIASGIAQFTADTQKGLNGYIFKNSTQWAPPYVAENLIVTKKKYAKDPKISKRLDELEEMLTFNVDSKKKRTLNAVSGEENLQRIRDFLVQLDRDTQDETIRFWSSKAKTSLTSLKSRQMWKNYYQGKTAPSTFDRMQGEQSIIAGAIYIKALEEQMGFTSTSSSIPEINKFVMIASSYNAGPGNFAKWCKITDTPEACAKKVTSTENKNYIKYINHCLTRGSKESTHVGGINLCEKAKPTQTSGSTK